MSTGERERIVVTGSSGLVGTRLVNRIRAEGRYEVLGLDVKPPEDANLRDGFIPCDLTDGASVRDSFEQIRQRGGSRIASVVHLAAYYDFSGLPSPLYRELTVEGTRRVLDALSAFDVGQLCFSSSLLVMEPADDEGAEIGEESATRAEWDYPRSKLETERLLQRESDGIPVAILRLAGAYDEQCHSIPLARQIQRIREKRLESYFFPGDPGHGQPFVHLSDAIECVLCAVERRAALPERSLFLVAEPHVMSYEALQDRIGELLHGREWPTVRLPKPLAKLGAYARERLSASKEEPFIKPWMIDLADAHYPVEIARARERLDWEPCYRLRDVIPQMIEALRRDPKRWYAMHGLEFPGS